MPRRAALSRPRQRACPSRSAVSGTGTTATPGSGTRRSPSTPSSAWASLRRPRHSPAGCETAWPHRWPAPRGHSTSCTASTGRQTSLRRSWSTGRATGVRARSGSGTEPLDSCSSTSTARQSTASTTRTSAASSPGTGAGSRCAASSTGSRRTGTSLKKGSGKPAAAARTSPTAGS